MVYPFPCIGSIWASGCSVLDLFMTWGDLPRLGGFFAGRHRMMMASPKPLANRA